MAPSKLWTSEPRMFNERIIYLNKSTTKYAIIGIDPCSFVSVMRICDRASGAHIALSLNQFNSFALNVKQVLEGLYDPDAPLEAESFCDIKFIPCSGAVKDVWKLQYTNGPKRCVVMQRTTLETFLHLESYILRELIFLDGAGYKKFIATIIKTTDGMTDEDIGVYLQSEIAKYEPDSAYYSLYLDLICNRNAYIQYPNLKDVYLQHNNA